MADPIEVTNVAPDGTETKTSTSSSSPSPSGEGAAAAVPPEPPVVQPPAVQPPAPDWAAVVGGLALDDEIKTTALKAGGLADALKQFHNQQALIGRKGVIVPAKTQEEAPDEWEKFYTELGRPAAPDGYVVPPQLPAEMTPDDLDPDFVAWARKTCHQQGLPQRSFAGLLSAYVEMERGLTAKAQEATKQAEAVAIERLDTMYAGRSEEVRADVKALLRQYGGDETIEAIEAAGLDLHEKFIPAMYTLSRRLREDGLFGETKMNVILSKEDAIAKRDALRRDNAQILANTRHPDHARVTKEFQELQQIIYKDEPGISV